MPANLIADDIRRIGVLDLHDERRIEELAKSYHVSTQAMTDSIAANPELSRVAFKAKQPSPCEFGCLLIVVSISA
jgi:hypothetical protein